MGKPENVMQVFSLLDKSNCRRCGEKTCLAFAGAVFQGRRNLAECPRIGPQEAASFDDSGSAVKSDEVSSDAITEMKKEISRINLTDAAERTGGTFENGKLHVKVLGKDLAIDGSGKIFTELHHIPWLIGPFLVYVLHSRGKKPAGNWLSMRETTDGAARYPLFNKRCEEAMQRLADEYTDFFGDMVHLFQGREIESPFASDICVVLPVFPLVPVMICYWSAEEGMESTLKVFFDKSIDDNLGGDMAFTLGSGLSQMFDKLARRHGLN